MSRVPTGVMEEKVAPQSQCAALVTAGVPLIVKRRGAEIYLGARTKRGLRNWLLSASMSHVGTRE